MLLLTLMLASGMAHSSVQYRLTPIHATTKHNTTTTENQVACMNMCSSNIKCCGFRFSLNSDELENCILLEECYLNVTSYHLGMPSYLKSYKDISVNDITSTISTKTTTDNFSSSAQQITTVYDSTAKITTQTSTPMIEPTTTDYSIGPYEYEQCVHVPKKNRKPSETSQFERMTTTDEEFNRKFPNAKKDYANVAFNAVFEVPNEAYYVAMQEYDTHSDGGGLGIFITWDAVRTNWTMNNDNRMNNVNDVHEFNELTCKWK